MGKSFNDDVFNNRLNLESINGLNISQEAIEENKEKTKPKIDISNIDINEVKKIVKEEQKKATKDTQEELKEIIKEQERLENKYKEYEQLQAQTTEEQPKEKQKEEYIKRTMIFKSDYLDIINGLANINDMQVKDVLNQLLERAIKELDDKTRDKALKTGKKIKPVKTEKNIF